MQAAQSSAAAVSAESAVLHHDLSMPPIRGFGRVSDCLAGCQIVGLAVRLSGCMSDKVLVPRRLKVLLLYLVPCLPAATGGSHGAYQAVGQLFGQLIIRLSWFVLPVGSCGRFCRLPRILYPALSQLMICVPVHRLSWPLYPPCLRHLTQIPLNRILSYIIF